MSGSVSAARAATARATPQPAGRGAGDADQLSESAVPAIGLVGVGKDFSGHGDQVAAVNQIDIDIREGEFFSLLGPSGCGKTTTLRMIAGFEVPTRGHVLLYGKDVTSLPPNKRDVNMVFQNYALFPHMSVRDNVAFGLERRKVDKQEVRQRVGEALELVELSGREKRRPRELSGGQQQRVALARALVNRPRALLLDEPLGALDLKLRQTMQIELKRIQREVGITFVYVTHDQGEALTMSDRLAVMHDGSIEQIGPPRDLYERPDTRFVAGFIGTSNVITGRAAELGPDGAVLRTGPDELAVVPLHQPVSVGDSVEATVRPERMRLSVEPPTAGCRLRGRVQEIVYLGTSTNYTVGTALGDVVVLQFNVDDDSPLVQRGDELWVGWPAQHGYQLSGGHRDVDHPDVGHDEEA
jgi:spermidine/putrescine transport system ATP-binding protein